MGIYENPETKIYLQAWIKELLRGKQKVIFSVETVMPHNQLFLCKHCFSAMILYYYGSLIHNRTKG